MKKNVGSELKRRINTTCGLLAEEWYSLLLFVQTNPEKFRRYANSVEISSCLVHNENDKIILLVVVMIFSLVITISEDMRKRT